MNKHRTLLRLQAIDTHHIHFVLPAWDPLVPVGVDIDDIPDDIKNACFAGQDYFYARVHLGADSEADLDFSDWEIGDET